MGKPVKFPWVVDSASFNYLHLKGSVVSMLLVGYTYAVVSLQRKGSTTPHPVLSELPLVGNQQIEISFDINGEYIPVLTSTVADSNCLQPGFILFLSDPPGEEHSCPT